MNTLKTTLSVTAAAAVVLSSAACASLLPDEMSQSPAPYTTPSTISTPSSTASASPLAPATPDPSTAGVFPVNGDAHYGKAHHNYPATDIFAPCGSPVLSPVDGDVVWAPNVDKWSPKTNVGADRGGISFAIDAGGVRYYGSHLSAITITVGQRVKAGQQIGTVGVTGSAKETPCHLHFGVSPSACPIESWWIRRGIISPYRHLQAWQNGSASDGLAQAVQDWSTANGCPVKPSTYG